MFFRRNPGNAVPLAAVRQRQRRSSAPRRTDPATAHVNQSDKHVCNLLYASDDIVSAHRSSIFEEVVSRTCGVAPVGCLRHNHARTCTSHHLAPRAAGISPYRRISHVQLSRPLRRPHLRPHLPSPSLLVAQIPHLRMHFSPPHAFRLRMHPSPSHASPSSARRMHCLERRAASLERRAGAITVAEGDTRALR